MLFLLFAVPYLLGYACVMLALSQQSGLSPHHNHQVMPIPATPTLLVHQITPNVNSGSAHSVYMRHTPTICSRWLFQICDISGTATYSAYMRHTPTAPYSAYMQHTLTICSRWLFQICDKVISNCVIIRSLSAGVPPAKIIRAMHSKQETGTNL